jgi:hypothetical protein
MFSAVFQMYVVSVCLPNVSDISDGCCNYFIQILQVFYLDVAKVDINVPCVAMIIQLYFKCILHMW